MSVINVKDEHSTAKYYISPATATEMCTDTAWFIKNKHHILLLCCSTNVIIPVAVHSNRKCNHMTRERWGCCLGESAWLAAWLCPLWATGKQEPFFCSRSMILFHPVPLSWEPRFWMALTSVAFAGPHWPPTLQLFILPVQHTAQYPQFAEAGRAAPLWAQELTPRPRPQHHGHHTGVPTWELKHGDKEGET